MRAINTVHKLKVTRETGERTASRREVLEIRPPRHGAEVCRLSAEAGTRAEREGPAADSIRGGYRARSREGSRSRARRRRGAILADEDNGSAAADSLRQARLLHRHSVAAVQRDEGPPGRRLPRALATRDHVSAVIQEPAQTKVPPLLSETRTDRSALLKRVAPLMRSALLSSGRYGRLRLHWTLLILDTSPYSGQVSLPISDLPRSLLPDRGSQS